ncbi:MAG: cysteine hydrolase [Desulfuromonadaceae bacterium]|nr:cysteine hydrolase [Desulfuromonadaceae bacterium]
MTYSSYTKEQTALLLVDPYNDFLSNGGKLWPLVEAVAGEVGLLDNLRNVMSLIRATGIRIFFVPHRRLEPGDYESWAHPSPDQIAVGKRQVFAKGAWGGEWHPDFMPQSGDIVIKEHWAQNGFASTDLDFQLKQHGIDKVILVGMLANTCIEATGRYAMELGYHVTLVKDATAAFSMDRMHAAHTLNGPNFAHAIMTTAELIAVLPQA